VSNAERVSSAESDHQRTLRATYRLQLTPECDFAFARGLIPYLAELGISHLYLSPSLQARAGSTHGYDVADPSQLSAELGGETEFRALAAAAHEAGMGLILDVVPNHMAASDENRYWADPELRTRFFDIDVTGPHPPHWRRFFDIDELAAVRVERDEVFEATHQKVLALVAEGLVDGLRVDHPDGLADPEGYLVRLREAGVARVWVEKILGAEERLPDSWPVSGTVGYDFLNDLVGLCVNPDAEDAFTALWTSVSGDPRPFGAWGFEAKLQQALTTFTPEVERLARCVDGRQWADMSHSGTSSGPPSVEALALALASLPVYRSYTPPSAGEFITRFQQTSPAIMAKGVEDTAFYRYCRLLALNEVGSDPGRFSLSVEAFHAHNAERAVLYPEALLTTMTHDAKRSADVRARLVALTWFPQEWTSLVQRWLDFTSTSTSTSGDGAGDGAGDGPDAIDRYFILQTLVGFPPMSSRWERIDAYLEKALREAKRNSSWIEPDTAYEHGAKAWARAILDNPEFHTDFSRVLVPAEELGDRISRAWVALKILSPGVPDIYQGDELEFSALVDPDNRRPVDWDLRRMSLGGHDPKMALISALLALRAKRPEAFGPAGDYVALSADPGTIAFTRGGSIEVRVGIDADSGFGIDVRDLD
jgi:(1->4)-alpha-D-glucan 1-alpha-D-glucosylmutase